MSANLRSANGSWAPGPWELHECVTVTDHGFRVHAYPITAGGQAIARVWGGSVGKKAFGFGNQEANARLIAASPTLAKAADEALDHLHRALNDPDGTQQASAVMDAYDALKSALDHAIGRAGRRSILADSSTATKRRWRT